jgi:hypothetical protein
VEKTMINKHENCKPGRQTELLTDVSLTDLLLTDLPLTKEQVDETKAGLRGASDVHEIVVTKVTDGC